MRAVRRHIRQHLHQCECQDPPVRHPGCVRRYAKCVLRCPRARALPCSPAKRLYITSCPCFVSNPRPTFGMMSCASNRSFHIWQSSTWSSSVLSTSTPSHVCPQVRRLRPQPRQAPRKSTSPPHHPSPQSPPKSSITDWVEILTSPTYVDEAYDGYVFHHPRP